MFWANDAKPWPLAAPGQPPCRLGVGESQLDYGGLFQRQDDTPAAVAHRLNVYRERSTPVLARYQQAGRLISVDATLPAQEIAADLASRIDHRS